MEKRRYLLPLVSILFLVFISGQVLANGSVEPEWYQAPASALFIIFVIGPIIESLIVLLFLKEGEKLRTYLLLFIYFLFINFFTLGPTQFFVRLLAGEFGMNLFPIAEIFPILVEFLALLLFFSYYKRKGLLKNEYASKYQFLMVLVSNTVTILLGVVLFFLLPV